MLNQTTLNLADLPNSTLEELYGTFELWGKVGEKAIRSRECLQLIINEYQHCCGVLEIAPGVSLQKIKKAYYKKAKENHSDWNNGKGDIYMSLINVARDKINAYILICNGNHIPEIGEVINAHTSRTYQPLQLEGITFQEELQKLAIDMVNVAVTNTLKEINKYAPLRGVIRNKLSLEKSIINIKKDIALISRMIIHKAVYGNANTSFTRHIKELMNIYDAEDATHVEKLLIRRFLKILLLSYAKLSQADKRITSQLPMHEIKRHRGKLLQDEKQLQQKASIPKHTAINDQTSNDAGERSEDECDEIPYSSVASQERHGSNPNKLFKPPQDKATSGAKPLEPPPDAERTHGSLPQDSTTSCFCILY